MGAVVTTSSEIVSKLWRLCTLLRKDGVTYPQYVTELTYLMFLKLASSREDGRPASALTDAWARILQCDDATVLENYRSILATLGSAGDDGLVHAIFDRADTVVRDPGTLRRLVSAVDETDWSGNDRDLFGDAYEGLLQKNAEETKRGAGQYFTPRALVDTMVALTDPQPGEVVQDPAAGTGGFFIAAKNWIDRSPHATGRAEFRGVENVIDTFRLLCMNLYLHGIGAAGMFMGDTLSELGCREELSSADLILSNPPFGASGGTPARDDLTITARSTGFQLPFVEHCMRALAPNGRAAVIVPDSVLFDGGRGRALRQELMRTCDLHTILRLPPGIFYAQGVRTNVLFFSRPAVFSNGEATTDVWVYDMRANTAMGSKGSTGFAGALAEFAAAFGKDPFGRSKRVDTGPEGRFRCFSREDIRARDDDLYVTWLRESEDIDGSLDAAAPEEVAGVVEQHLTLALDEIKALMADLLEDAPEAENA
jgi:type I restriction enzyme M protein